MKSIKPGRGPSAMGAMGSIIAVIFGIFWTIAAASMGAPFFFPLFGVLFIIMGIVQAVYNFKNATWSGGSTAKDQSLPLTVSAHTAAPDWVQNLNFAASAAGACRMISEVSP